VQLIYYAYVAGSAVARWLPERFAYAAAQLVGRWSARFSGKRHLVARNLSRITGLAPDSPEVARLVVAAYQSYARYWLETFRLVREGRDFFLERFQTHQQDRLDAVYSKGKGVIVVVGHLGNWDAAGAWVGATGRSLVTVAEILKPRRMFDFFAEHRARLGMTIYPARAGVTRALAGALEEGAIVAILGDRDLKGTGPEVSFFGEPASFPAGPASIALTTGVPLLVAGVFGVVRDDGSRGWDAFFSEPIEPPPGVTGKEAIERFTQRIASALEVYVAMRPEEWHVLQPFWIADRGAAPAAETSPA
jgi:KDO2-lipid IV(A) lauroyltransferase